MRFWAGVSAIAGALKRNVFIDQYYFRWYPNFYIIFVAEPDIVSKSTTTGTAMSLLKKVEGVQMGPNVATWQALVQFLASAQTEQIGDDGKPIMVAPLTISSSEFGNFLNPRDLEMVDLLVSLWDGADISKITKMSGRDAVPYPLLNLNACTTPSWISMNIPQYMVGGGLLSRCMFVYASAKEKYIAYPGLAVPSNIKNMEYKLIEDLTAISQLQGEFAIDKRAIEWGQEWYETLFRSNTKEYITRKQTHVHKMAMILSAARRDTLIIELEDIKDAEKYISRAGVDLAKVLMSVGRSQEASSVDRLLKISEQLGTVSLDDLYHEAHSLYPRQEDFNQIVMSAVKAKLMLMEVVNSVVMVSPL